MGRVSQIIKINGKRILPIDVEEIVAKTEGLENDFRNQDKKDPLGWA